MARKIIKEAFKKENGQLVEYPLGAEAKNVIVATDEDGKIRTLDQELNTIKQQASSAHNPNYNIENIEKEQLELLAPGKQLNDNNGEMRKIYKAVLKLINHLKNTPNTDGSKHGTAHIPPGGEAGNILLWAADGQAKWGPDDDSYSDFTGATATTDGVAGLVKAPIAGQQDRFLKADGSWAIPSDTKYTEGVGIDISSDRKIGLESITTAKDNVGKGSTTGRVITIPYFSVDAYGRIKSYGSQEHSIPETDFTGGTLTENLYFGTQTYGINTAGDGTLSHLQLYSATANDVNLEFGNSVKNAVIGLDGVGNFYFKPDLNSGATTYEYDNTGKKHLIKGSVFFPDLKHADGAGHAAYINKYGQLSWSTTTQSELYYLSGVTSAVQGQLDKKLPLTGGTLTNSLSIINTTVDSETNKATWIQYQLKNGFRDARFATDTAGSMGLYDSTNSNWLIKSDVSQNVSLRGSTIALSGPTTINKGIENGLSISKAGFATLFLKRIADSKGVGGTSGAAVVFQNDNGVLGSIAMSGTADGGLLRYTGDFNSYYTMVDSGNYSSIITTTKSNVTKPTSGTTYMIPFHAYLSETGNTIIRCNDGLRYTSIEGTASSNGYSILNLGNGIKSGTAGNKYGLLKLFGTGEYYVQIKAEGAPTANRTISFPDINGTVPIVASASGKGSASITLEANSFYLVSVNYGGNMYYNGYAATGSQGVTLIEINRQGGGNESHIDGYKITFTSASSSYTVVVKYIKIR